MCIFLGSGSVGFGPTYNNALPLLVDDPKLVESS